MRPYVKGWGALTANPGEVSVTADDGSVSTLSTKNVILATAGAGEWGVTTLVQLSLTASTWSNTPRTSTYAVVCSCNHS